MWELEEGFICLSLEWMRMRTAKEGNNREELRLVREHRDEERLGLEMRRHGRRENLWEDELFRNAVTGTE
jgi:hypothetical protein